MTLLFCHSHSHLHHILMIIMIRTNRKNRVSVNGHVGHSRGHCPHVQPDLSHHLWLSSSKNIVLKSHRHQYHLGGRFVSPPGDDDHHHHHHHHLVISMASVESRISQLCCSYDQAAFDHNHDLNCDFCNGDNGDGDDHDNGGDDDDIKEIAGDDE